MNRRVLPSSFFAVIGFLALAAQGQDAAPMTGAEYQKAINESQKTIADSQKTIAELKQPTPAPKGSSSGTATEGEAEHHYGVPPAAVDPEKAKEGLDPPPGQQPPAGLGGWGGTGSTENRNGNGSETNPTASTPPPILRHEPADSAEINRLRQEVEALKQTVEVQGADILRLAKSLENSERNEGVPIKGHLRIRNDMNTEQSIRINGREWIRLAPKDTQTVEVPIGTVTTDLPGEATKSWLIGPSHYEQEIIIAPAPAAPRYGPWRYDSWKGVWYRDIYP